MKTVKKPALNKLALWLGIATVAWNCGNDNGGTGPSNDESSSSKGTDIELSSSSNGDVEISSSSNVPSSSSNVPSSSSNLPSSSSNTPSSSSTGGQNPSSSSTGGQNPSSSSVAQEPAFYCGLPDLGRCVTVNGLTGNENPGDDCFYSANTAFEGNLGSAADCNQLGWTIRTDLLAQLTR